MPGSATGVIAVGDFSTAKGFEALRAEPYGFRAHLLGRSDTLSLTPKNRLGVNTHNQPESPCTHELPTNQIPGTPEHTGSWDFGQQALLDCGVWMRRSPVSILATR